MENPFSRLAKVLALERKQGYRNKAVIGGLDKFANRWENEARAACDSQSLVNEVVALMLGYSSVEGQPALRTHYRADCTALAGGGTGHHRIGFSPAGAPGWAQGREPGRAAGQAATCPICGGSD